MARFLVLIALVFGFNTLASAQQSTSSTLSTGSETPVTAPAATATSTASSSTTVEQYKINAPTFGPFRMRAGLKSTNTTGRIADYDTVTTGRKTDSSQTGRRSKQKHEYYLGAVHSSGWGLYGQAVTSGSTYDVPERSNLSAGDPSATLLHPDFYKDANLQVSGQLRRYFAVTDKAVNRVQKQWAYYVYTNYKMPAQWTVWNQAAPRYFDQNFYDTAKADTQFFFEDITNVTKQISQSFGVGFGQWTQFETHPANPTGYSTELIGYVRFTPIANAVIEPRVYLPAYLKNFVYDAPRAVALDQVRGELFAQISL